MPALRKERMTVNEFLSWAEHRPERWELFDGAPTAMSPERVIHGDTIYRIARALDEAIAKARVPCRFVVDSAAVRIDATNSYQPDVMVYCGDMLPADTLIVPNPVVVCEVLSPSTAITDMRDKLQGYFRVTSVQHYLIVDPEKQIVIHHARGSDGIVATRIIAEGSITLAPPGVTLMLAAIFSGA
jgi:Uma2 family endonuclease